MIGTAIVVLLFALGWTLIVTAFPYRILGGDAVEPDAEDARRFRRWDLVLRLVSVPSMLGCTVGAWFALRALLERHFASETMGGVLATAPVVTWAIPAVLLGVAATLIPVTLVGRILLRGDWASFLAWQDRRAGGDVIRPVRVFAFLLAVGLPVYSWFALHTYANFAGEGIRVSRMGELVEHIYDYERVADITLFDGTIDAFGGAERHEPFAVITFDDGTQWSTRSMPGEFHGGGIASILRIVSLRAGVPIRDAGHIDTRRRQSSASESSSVRVG